MSMRKLIHLLAVMSLWGVTTGAVVAEVAAGDPGRAGAIVREATQTILAAVKEDREGLKNDPQRLYKMVNQVVLPHFDFRRMARRVLGKNWRRATAEQRERFVAEFKRLLVRTYATAVTEYRGQTVKYLPAVKRPGRDEVTVRTEVREPGGLMIPITYTMYLKEGAWRVFDVIVDGVSLVINYRASFRSEIRRGGLDALIDRLSSKNQEPTA